MCFKASYLSLTRTVCTGTVFTGAYVLIEQVPRARCHAEGDGEEEEGEKKKGDCARCPPYTHTYNPNPPTDYAYSSAACTTLGMLV